MILLTKINLTNNSYNVSHLLTPKLWTMARFKDRPKIKAAVGLVWVMKQKTNMLFTADRYSFLSLRFVSQE